MKKIEYQAPEMEVIKLKANMNLLSASSTDEVAPGTGDAEGL